MREDFDLETSAEEDTSLSGGVWGQNMIPEKGPDIYGFVVADAPRMVETYKLWRKKAPDIHAVVSEFCSWVDFSRESLNLINVAANLATEEMNNPYHNNLHSLEVFSFAFSLGYDAYQEGRITEKEFALLLTSALLHDYAHDGTTNDGEQFKLERASVESFMPALIGAGASLDDRAMIRAMVFATDVTKDFSNPESKSPADTLKLYKAGKIDHIHEALEILEDKGVVELAVMLVDSDIGVGFLDKDFLNENTRNLNEENGTPLGKPSQQFFFSNVCGNDLLYSNSGAKLFGQRLVAIKNYVFDDASLNRNQAPK
ncbi:MAG: hypothetical protein ACPG05_01180 [Bdellovibrionales bacterium]